MLYHYAALALALAIAPSHGLAVGQGRPVVHGSTRAAVSMNEDPTGSPFIQAINALQEAIQTSPIAKFKKEFAKMQAGSYDEAATKKKLESQIADTPAIMYSFTT